MDIETLRVQHLELLKKFLIRFEFDDEAYTFLKVESFPGKLKVLKPITRLLPQNWAIARKIIPPELSVREYGQDWPITAESMIGLIRMNQLHEALGVVREENIEGDIVEAGIWRGGAVIFAATYIDVYGMKDRKIYGCDSFEGLPVPDPKYPEDAGDSHWKYDILKVSLVEVERNLKKYNINRDKVILVKGWFEDTLSELAVEKIAILRLDGDMYSSTMASLNSLYEKVTSGGFVIIDDYSLDGAKKALHDYLGKNAPKIIDIDGTGAYFRKP
jgi:O-methyltransferase